MVAMAVFFSKVGHVSVMMCECIEYSHCLTSIEHEEPHQEVQEINTECTDISYN